MREAKARLSQLLRDVKRGREWTITERGKPVARLVAVDDEPLSLDERLRRMEEAGEIEPALESRQKFPPPLPLEFGLAQRWLQEDREG